MNNPYPWLQDFINQVPDILQPVIVALAAAIPYVEGEGASVFGILAGINPIVAATAAVIGNVLAVVAVVLFGSRARGVVIARRAKHTEARRTQHMPVAALTGGSAGAGAGTGTATMAVTDMERVTAGTRTPNASDAKPTHRSKGRAKLRRWMVKFGVPGASLLAPLALPTMLTAAFFVASGVRKEWVILWQIIAIILWTAVAAAAAAGLLTLLGW